MAAFIRNMCAVSKQNIITDFQVFGRLNSLKQCQFVSAYATETKLQLDAGFEDYKMKKGKQFSYRKHPGVMNVKRVTLPVKLETVINKLLNIFEMKGVEKSSDKLRQYLWSRHLPVEVNDLRANAMKLEEEEMKAIANFDEMPQDEQYRLLNEKKDKILRKLRKSTYHWEAINYDARRSVIYMVTRMVQEYSAMFRVLSEISRRVPEFEPTNLFDFGSGTGSVMWAANTVWPKAFSEHYCVDTSNDMNTLAQLILQDGMEKKEMCFKGVFFRQFLPGSHKAKYRLVVSAYSLFELPSASERQKVIEALWKKTDDFLVIVEHGTGAGFKVITEARKIIRRLSISEKLGKEKLTRTEKDEEVRLVGHVFAPCPHDKPCPRLEGTTPCNFDVAYKPLELFEKDGKKLERFCYIVFRKGEKSSEEPSWPRIVRPVSLPARHVHCRLCCSDGKLQHHVLTAKKHGKDLYKSSRVSVWGDLLPATLTIEEKEKTTSVNEGKQYRNIPLYHKLSARDFESEQVDFESDSMDDSTMDDDISRDNEEMEVEETFSGAFEMEENVPSDFSDSEVERKDKDDLGDFKPAV